MIKSLAGHGYSTMTLTAATFSKESIALSWRQQSMLSEPNQKGMARILMQLYLILVWWVQKGYKM